MISKTKEISAFFMFHENQRECNICFLNNARSMLLSKYIMAAIIFPKGVQNPMIKDVSTNVSSFNHVYRIMEIGK